MKAWVAILVSSALFVGATLPGAKKPNEECVFEAAKPGIDRKDKSIRSYKIQRSPAKSVETVVLNDGLKITYQTGGCDHFGVSISFESFPPLRKAKPAAYIAAARKMLAQLPSNAESQSWKKSFDKDLKRATAKPGDDEFPFVIPLPENGGGSESVLEVESDRKMTLSFTQS